jgi:translation initiation factor IF-2
MAQMTVSQFATELKVEPARLLEQLKSAGVHKTALGDSLTEQDKSQLLDYLHKAHGGGEARNRITLTRRQTTEIKQADGTGRSRTIQVEVRKKRVFVKRDALPGEPESVETPAEVVAPVVEVVPEPVPEPAPLPASAPVSAPAPVSIIGADQQALRDEEERKHRALSALQAEELRLKQEARERSRLEAEEATREALCTFQPGVAAGEGRSRSSRTQSWGRR